MINREMYDDCPDEFVEMTWSPNAGDGPEQALAGKPAATQEGARLFNVTWWRVERVFSDLACLGKVTGDLERFGQQFVVGSSVLSWGKKLAEEATRLLHTIYQACVRYRLDGAAHITLALEDVYTQVAQGEMVADEALFDLTRTYVAQLDSAIRAIREGESPELGVFEPMFDSVAVKLGR